MTRGRRSPLHHRGGGPALPRPGAVHRRPGGAGKNGTQTAADAAALAAAQSYRDQLRTGLLAALGGPAGQAGPAEPSGPPSGPSGPVLPAGGWEDWLTGRVGSPDAACGEAAAYADANGAGLTGPCRVSGGPLPVSFSVTVRSSEPVGRSVVPGTENTYPTASARAVVEPRCAAKSPREQKPPIEVVCAGQEVSIDPGHPEDLRRAVRALFAVRLAD
ncbi:hypothetical protein ACFQ2B_10745 [Streptomyces stramineus]